MPFIVLRGGGNKIRNLVIQAREQQIQFSAFIHTMTGGTYVEQLENTKAISEEDLTYYGAILYGKWDQVSQMTKKFSLWK